MEKIGCRKQYIPSNLNQDSERTVIRKTLITAFFIRSYASFSMRKEFLNFITSNYYNDFKFFYFNAFSQSGTKPKRLSNCAS